MKENINAVETASLVLKDIVKVYGEGETAVTALKGVSLNFRKSEFVSVLGQSGCGKTTMLNLIGGLDRYTSGDMLINGKSTKDFKDRDWDTYRNHSIGFVFQSYNLIPHQSVLQNVELALALSGVSKHERKERAKQALIAVGLDTQFNKKPGEMSGGQMQRVAIARALVNNPDIILADEPTGALDSETSIQVMEILKEVSKDRLVIMVTHNPELAEKYSTRIVRMLDGKIIEDTNPLIETEPPFTARTEDITPQNATEAQTETKRVKRKKANKVKKPSMSLWTAFSLSLKNLFTKKGRTILTSFAGSIGIIGIALIYAVSQGMTNYVNHVQETTLASYPLTIEEKTMDLTSLMESFMNVGGGEVDHDKDAIYKEAIITELVNALAKTETSENDLKSFKEFLETEIATEGSKLNQAVTGVQYTYDMELAMYTENIDGEIIKSDTGELMSEMLAKYMLGVSTNGNGSPPEDTSSSGNSSGNFMSNMIMGGGMWQEILPATDGSPINDFVKGQYDLVHGSWPNEKDEIVLIVNENNELDDLTLYALGLISKDEIDAIIDSAVNGTELPPSSKSWSYNEIMNMTFRTVLPADKYEKVGDIYVDMSSNGVYFRTLFEKSFELKVSGIIRPSATAESPMLSSGIGYTNALTAHIIESAKQSSVIKAQLETPDTDVLTGLPFKATTGSLTPEQKETHFREYVAGMNESKKADTFLAIQSIMPKQELDQAVNAQLATYTDKDALSLVLANAIASQTGIDANVVLGYFSDMTLDELKGLMRPMLEEQVKAYYANQVKLNLDQTLPTATERANALDNAMGGYDTAKCAELYDNVVTFSKSTYEGNMQEFGYLDLATPSGINIYTATFENKDVIKAVIERYNNSVDEDKKIDYTDYVGLIMSSVTTIINAITYVLIAFVSVSLIVSSIMIGVITLISVQERTKEIGILRAIGASKRNVSSMFNAETLIIGFSSGLFGVLITYLLCIPINIILHVLTGIANLSATLPPLVALILIAISMLLTLVAGIIPSRSAAKKDPVVALRTE